MSWKTIKITGWILTGILGLLTGARGIFKLSSAETTLVCSRKC